MSLLSTQTFIERVRSIHGDTFDYSRVVYTGMNNYIEVTRPPSKEIIRVRARYILDCRYKGTSLHMDTTRFINRAKTVYGESRFDFTKTIYIDMDSLVTVTCPIHGDFQILAKTFLRGYNCKKCSNFNVVDTNQFIERSVQIFGDMYDYSFVNYVNINERVSIICKKHGVFKIVPKAHLRGAGCKLCSGYKGEIVVGESLRRLSLDFIPQYSFDDLKIKKKLLFDFYIPDYNMLIEYDGFQHYTSIDRWGGKDGLLEVQRRDEMKNLYCKEKGIRLLRIPYWDITRTYEIITSFIKTI